MATITDASKKTIAEILSSSSQRRVVVPDYQRSYAWSKSEVETFWLDLLAFDQRFPGEAALSEEYFLGSIVAVSKPREMVLIDGQQRLATATLLLAAIRDTSRELTDVLPDRIQRDFIRSDGPLQSGPRYSLTLNAYDRDFFRHVVQDYPRPGRQLAPEYASHSLILKAQTLLSDAVENLVADLSDSSSKQARLDRLKDVLAHRLTVVLVTAEQEDDANEVFETLNDRGVGLSTLDLLRNFILGRARESDRALIVEWWREVFSVSDSPSRVQTFLRHFWVSRYGDVKSRGLYKEIKRVLSTEFEAGTSNPRDFSIDISTSADAYQQLITATTDSPDLNAALSDVRTLGAGATYPLALAAFEKRSPDECTRLLNHVLSLYVRWSVIGNRESTDLEEFAFKLATDIWNGASPDEVVQRIASFAPSDSEFQEAFANASLSRPGHRRYVLERLERAMRLAEEQDELEPASPQSVHVEHVYPQSPREGHVWDEHDAWVHRIGNLTLLHRRLNTRIKNAPYDEKKPELARSHLLLTRDVVEHESWSQLDIDQRQQRLAQYAPGIWPNEYR